MADNMQIIRAPDGDLAEDGHPCEAALQFRRTAIRLGVADEISGDALDLAVSFAWIGKAVSRTNVAAEWCVNGVDPNTYSVIALLGSTPALRRQALEIATGAPAMVGRERNLGRIRATSGFSAAVAAMKAVTSAKLSVRDMMRLSEISEVLNLFPVEERSLAFSRTTGNVVMLDAFRGSKAATR